MNQILNHTFFTGNKFSFCVPSIPQNMTNNAINPQSSRNPLISTPELVKTTEKGPIDLKPRKIFNNNDFKSDRETKIIDNSKQNEKNISKSCKSISSSVGSKAFLQNFDGSTQVLPKKIHKQSFDTKENFFNYANFKENLINNNNHTISQKNTNFNEKHHNTNNKHIVNNTFINNIINNKNNDHINNSIINNTKNNRLNRSKEKIINKSIEIPSKTNKNELDQYLKTEVENTPKSKKSTKVNKTLNLLFFENFIF